MKYNQNQEWHQKSAQIEGDLEVSSGSLKQIEADVLIEAVPWYMRRWWLKSRVSIRGVQLNNDMVPCMEFYVPLWAWPLEILYRAIFGKTILLHNDKKQT